MSADDHAADALRRLADEDQRINTAHLPEAVTDRLQWIVDRVAWECEHVVAARDLPPAALPKIAIQGVPLVACASDGLCNFDLLHRVQIWHFKIDESCSLCGAPPWKTRWRTVFTDEAAGLSMVGFVCPGCVEKLAAWVGVPR
jgi:hypothetical protein